MEEETKLSKSIAFLSCGAMAILYVAILYSPTLILRLPPPITMKSFMIRRFICATLASIISLVFCSFLLPMESWNIGAYGIRAGHVLQAVLLPLLLTSVVYVGSLVSKMKSFAYMRERLSEWVISSASDVLAWRNYVVAPITEEIVFRACMIPLLLCGGFQTYTIIFLSPIFFSLAHLNHFLELHYQQNYSFAKASLIVGFQLGYTVIFGWYASFLFIRTGHLVAPIIAHIVCNIMGLPSLNSKNKAIGFVAGMAGFMFLLFPATRPDIYNDNVEDCKCWHGYCKWS